MVSSNEQNCRPRDTDIFIALAPLRDAAEYQELYAELYERAKQTITAQGKWHEKLEMSEDAYLKRFPKTIQQPQQYRGALDVPILIDPEIPIESLDKATFSDLETQSLKGFEDLDYLQTPSKPYVMWVNLSELRFIEPDTLESECHQVLTLREAISLSLQLPNYSIRRLVADGSKNEDGEMALISRKDNVAGRAHLQLGRFDNPRAEFPHMIGRQALTGV